MSRKQNRRSSEEGKKISSIQAKTLSEAILDRLRSAIHDGVFMPGEHLVEQTLAKDFDVSRGPIRDALRQLEQEGLVVSATNRGTYVARLKLEDLREIYSLRAALDQLCVEQACENALASSFDELEEVLAQMGDAVDDGISGREAVELDLQFHDAMYRASRHTRLKNFWEMLRPQIKTLLLERVTEKPDFSDVLVPYHQAIFEVIALRDVESARELMRNHVENSYGPVAKALSHSSNQQSDPPSKKR